MSVPMVPFDDVVEDVSRGNPKLPQSQFRTSGSLPIIDQGQKPVAGYTDDRSLLCRVEGPVIVFGDHTRAVKYVDFPFVIGADGVKVLRVRDGWDPRYVFHYLASVDIPSAGYSRHYKFLRQITVPEQMPEEQRRISAILDRADSLIHRRRETHLLLASLGASIYRDMFDHDRADLVVHLADVADVSSGITKGRRSIEPMRSIPYLAVANVQAGHLRLENVKQIHATEREIERYRLAPGDVVLTEGGDPDKLGRGTVWRGELPECLHQNHIFRVRVKDQQQVVPGYLAACMAGSDARLYFRRSAKQTTGIASINITQLKALPLAIPPIAQQRDYVTRVKAMEEQLIATDSARLDELFASLQARAFAGEL